MFYPVLRKGGGKGGGSITFDGSGREATCGGRCFLIFFLEMEGEGGGMISSGM